MTSDETQPPTAWRSLIDDWVQREGQLHPNLPVRGESVRVRDAVEVGDHAYVLVSFDVDSPWPSEEDLGSATTAGAHTAVIQAGRVRQPWHELDSTRALSSWSTPDGLVTVHEHVLGPRRAFSGRVGSDASEVTLDFLEGDAVNATVVDGWFLAVVPEGWRAQAVSIDGGDPAALKRADLESMMPDPSFARTAGDAMYFSPLDLRSVLPLVQWTREEDVVAVVSGIEQYDEGGIVRLRVDGVRVDDDAFVAWPRVTLQVDGAEVSSAVCGEYSLADTLSLDIGFRPWLQSGAKQLAIRLEGLRGAQGEVAPITIEARLPEISG